MSSSAFGVPDPGGQAAHDDGEGEVAGYFAGQCGHPAPLAGPVWRVGPGEDCDAGPRA
ncbi:MAG: hypothetical protein ACRDRP_25025 [Pseudonocardiaceae bacterium]